MKHVLNAAVLLIFKNKTTNTIEPRIKKRDKEEGGGEKWGREGGNADKSQTLQF